MPTCTRPRPTLGLSPAHSHPGTARWLSRARPEGHPAQREKQPGSLSPQPTLALRLSLAPSCLGQSPAVPASWGGDTVQWSQAPLCSFPTDSPWPPAVWTWAGARGLVLRFPVWGRSCLVQQAQGTDPHHPQDQRPRRSLCSRARPHSRSADLAQATSMSCTREGPSSLCRGLALPGQAGAGGLDTGTTSRLCGVGFTRVHVGAAGVGGAPSSGQGVSEKL